MFGLLKSRTRATAAGTVLGHYQVLEKVGEGGFGCVYKAWDPLLERFVAIKTCQDAGPETRRRFARETRLAGSLNHPNIVSILDCDLEGDVLFLVQEFLEGEDLDAMIRRGEPSDLPGKLRILDQVCAGLCHAHDRGVIHRDVKPGNVRVLTGGFAKILDFGIARSLNDDTTLTGPGRIIGSAGYMAPEQIQGGPVDHRTDLFGLGVLAYELLAGRRAFEARSLSKLFDAILLEEPEPLSHLTVIPAPLEELVRHSMAKRVTDRPASVAEFRTRIEQIANLAAQQIPVAVPRPPSRRECVPRLGSLLATG